MVRTLFAALSVKADDATLGVTTVIDMGEAERLKVILEVVVFLAVLEVGKKCGAMLKRGTNREAICNASAIESM